MRDLPFEDRGIIQYLVRCGEAKTEKEISKKVKVSYLFTHLIELVREGFLKRDVHRRYTVTSKVDTLWFVEQLRKNQIKRR